jgi:hypothetical protein
MLSRVGKGSSLLDEYSGPVVRRVRYAMSTPTVLMNVLRRPNAMAVAVSGATVMDDQRSFHDTIAEI